MGISGLLPFLKNACRPASIDEFSGKVAAVDVYVWLHRGAFGCAEKLVRGESTDGYVSYAMRLVDMLLYYNIKPILVFDGRNLPSKAPTEAKRRENRERYRNMAKDYLNEGKYREAVESFQRAIDITPKMARDLIQACRDRNIDCIVAPYEADAQLAFLILEGIADIVISEDSDLTAFGCQKILFKMDKQGNGVLYDKDLLPQCLGNRALNLDFQKFRYMCIMAGCDYLDSLPGIGIGKSLKFWGKVTQPSLELTLPKIPAYLNMKKIEVTDEYVQKFKQANLTFLYQIVYDPLERKMKPLNPYGKDVEGLDLSFAGETITDNEVALDFALGNLNISGRKLNKVSNYDPENPPILDNPAYGKRASHSSIWTKENTSNVSTVLREQNKEHFSNISGMINEQNVTLPPNIGPVPRKELKNRTISDSAESNVQPANLHKDKKASDIKSNNEKVYYISKYFKKKIFDEDESGKVIANPPEPLTNNEHEENSSEDFLKLYNSKPKSIVCSPGSKISNSMHTKKDSNLFGVIDDENQENILSKETVKSKTVTNKLPVFQKTDLLVENIDEYRSIREQTNGDKIKGSWFEELEYDTAVRDTKIIYNTGALDLEHIKESSEHIYAKGDDKNLNSETSENVLHDMIYNNSAATRKAFKPVIQNTIDCNSSYSILENKNNTSLNRDNPELEKTRKRNPFAKVLKSSTQLDNIDNSKVNETYGSPSTHSVSSNKSYDTFTEDKSGQEVNTDNDKTNVRQFLQERFSASKKLSSLLSTSPTDCDQSAKKRKLSFSNTSSLGSNTQTSCYFSQAKNMEETKVPKNILGKARVSGLLKNKKCHQKNLLQMWSKNN